MEKRWPTPVRVIGGALMDIMGFPDQKLVPYDSTPGNLHVAPGGVGRNIAENLARLAVPVRLITAFGDDTFASMLNQQATTAGIDLSESLFLKKTTSGIHLAILDDTRDMTAGIAALNIFQALTPDFFLALKAQLEEAPLIVLETNIPQPTIEWLCRELKRPKLFLDPVTGPLARKVSNCLGYFHTIKANRQEAEVLSGLSIQTEADLVQAGRWFLDQGVQRIFITLGARGVYYADQQQEGQVPPSPVTVRNTTGAGDAFMAGLVFASLQDYDTEACARLGSACSAVALTYEGAVHPEIGKLLEKIVG